MRDHDGVAEFAVGVANDHGAAAAPAADHGGDFHDIGDDGDAVGAGHQAIGNGGVALRAQFFEHARGFDEPRFFARAGEGGLRDAGRAGGDEQQREE